MRRFYVIALFTVAAWLLAPLARCQSDSMIHVNQFHGTTVGDKVTAAMAHCPDAPIPCILVLDASLAAAAQGTFPALCANCYLEDFRSGPPSGISAATGVLYPTQCANGAIPSWCSGTDLGAWINAAIQHLPRAPIGGEIDIPTDPSGCWNIATEVIVDRPVTIRGQNWTFNSNGGTCLNWTGGSTPIFEVNGTSRASSNSILENLSLTNSTTATIGIDINGGQYNVLLRNVSITGGLVRFATAGVQVGSDTALYPDGDVTLENVRIGYQTTGLNILYANTLACVSCHIYSNNLANVHIGDSGHIVFNTTFLGGDIEQDDTSAPSFLLTNVVTLNLVGVYTELAANAQSVIALTSDCAHTWNVHWDGGYVNMNTHSGYLLNTNQNCTFPSPTFTINDVSVSNPISGAAIVSNPAYTAPSGVALKNITSDSTALAISTTSYSYFDLDNVMGVTARLLNDTGSICWENHAGNAQACLTKNTGDNLVFPWAIFGGFGIGPDSASGVTWNDGAAAPTGACVSGSLYTSRGGTTAGNNNLYVCSQSAWVAVK